MKRSLFRKCDIDISKVHTVVMEFIDTRVHLHLCHVELDVLLILSQIGDDCISVDLLKAILDKFDLRLCRVLAVCSCAAEAQVDGAKVCNTVFNVSVVALLDRLSRLVESFKESILIREAGRKVVVILLLSEHLDCTADVASDLFAWLSINIRKRFPIEIALFLLLNREHAAGKSFASFCVLALHPESSDTGPC